VGAERCGVAGGYSGCGRRGYVTPYIGGTPSRRAVGRVMGLSENVPIAQGSMGMRGECGAARDSWWERPWGVGLSPSWSCGNKG